MHKNSLMNQTLTPLALHEEVDASYVDLRASIEDYYDENVDHKDQTKKLVKETLMTLDNISLTKLINNAKLPGLLTKLEGFQSSFNTGWSLRCYKHSKECLPLPPQAMLLFQQFHNLKSVHLLGGGGENLEKQVIVWQKPPSYTKGEIIQIITTTKKPEDEAAKTPMEQEPERPTRVVSISTIRPITRPNPEVALIESSSRPSLTDPILEIHVVHEEAEKARIDPKIILSAKGGEQFKKIQDAEHQVHKRQHTEKAKKAMELRKKRLEQYIWITPSKLRPEPITNVKIHPNSKPLVLIVYRANDKRNFQVRNPFKFADFKVTELDELGPIIEKKKNKIVGELMISLGKRKRKHIELEPEIKVPGLECNRKFHEGVPFVNNMVIEEPKYGMFFINVFGDEAFQRMSDINKVGFDALLTYLVMASNITTPKNTRFCLKLRKLIAEHPNQEMLHSKKVKLESVGYKLD
ncbi:hypothetical protein Tco_0139893 [Tanacetum coccineum]